MFGVAAFAVVLFAGAAQAEDGVAVLKAQLDVKRANVKLAEATLAGAKRSFERLSQLKATGVVSAEDFDKAKQDADIATAQLEVRNAEVREAEARIKEREAGEKGAGSTIAVFNMSAVMHDFDKAKYQGHLLNLRRAELSAPLLKKRDELIALQKEISEETDPKNREKLVASFTALQQKFQLEEAELNKKLGAEASVVISEIHDNIKSAVEATAKAEGRSIVLAYPDAVTDEERANPYFKEMKLKPAAAIPFLFAKELDITAAVLKKLNADFPALDKDGKKVDVSKLPQPAAPGKKP